MAAQVVTTQPTTVIIQQTQQPVMIMRDWNSGLFGCFDDISSCIMGLLCPCVVICQLSSRMGEGCLYGCCCAEIAGLTLRAKLRTQYGIQGSLCNDAAVVYCCGVCAMCQMDRELKFLGK